MGRLMDNNNFKPIEIRPWQGQGKFMKGKKVSDY